MLSHVNVATFSVVSVCEISALDNIIYNGINTLISAEEFELLHLQFSKCRRRRAVTNSVKGNQKPRRGEEWTRMSICCEKTVQSVTHYYSKTENETITVMCTLPWPKRKWQPKVPFALMRSVTWILLGIGRLASYDLRLTR